MPKYTITVHCEWDIEVSFEAETTEDALALAEEDVAGRYTVFGREEEEYYPFDDIYAYESDK